MRYMRAMFLVNQWLGIGVLDAMILVVEDVLVVTIGHRLQINQVNLASHVHAMCNDWHIACKHTVCSVLIIHTKTERPQREHSKWMWQRGFSIDIPYLQTPSTHSLLSIDNPHQNGETAERAQQVDVAERFQY